MREGAFEQPTSWLLSDESAVLRSGALFAEAFNVCGRHNKERSDLGTVVLSDRWG